MLLIKSSAHQTEGKRLFCPRRPQIWKLALPKQYFTYMTHHHILLNLKATVYLLYYMKKQWLANVYVYSSCRRDWGSSCISCRITVKHGVKQAARLTQLGDTRKTLEWTGTDYTGLQHNRVNKSSFKIIQHYIKQVWLSCHLTACCRVSPKHTHSANHPCY